MARAELYTYFTRPDGQTHLLYSAEEQIRIRLRLETAGPVAFGTAEDLRPVLGGRGIQLTTDEDEIFILSKGDRLYMIAETINRVKFIVEPIPYTPEILAQMKGLETRETFDPQPTAAPPAKPGAVAPVGPAGAALLGRAPRGLLPGKGS